MSTENMTPNPTAAPAGSKTSQLLDALRTVTLPGHSADIVAFGLVKGIAIDGGEVRFNVVLHGATAEQEQHLERAVEACLVPLEWITGVDLGLVEGGGTAHSADAGVTPADTTLAPPRTSPFAAGQAGAQALAEAGAAARPPTPDSASGHRPLDGVLQSQRPTSSAFGVNVPAPAPAATLPSVKQVIAIGSGKGGVGKSTVSVNIALALNALGYKTGLLDGDVYGPSIPLMLGLSGQPYVNDEEKLVPPQVYGLKVISMGLLLRPEQAVVWRGPMVHGVMRQFISDVDWGELDFLIVDLPPGTGDAPLSLSQALPLTSTVVVTTPQELAASVAEKALAMFEKLGVRVLGVIENMSAFVCPCCGEQTAIFGSGGGQRLAEAHGSAFLGAIPLDLRMRGDGGDAPGGEGRPLMLAAPDSDLATLFKDIAAKLAAAATEKREQATR
jgi:ATP-binding protein involved in chromosome partitioning